MKMLMLIALLMIPGNSFAFNDVAPKTFDQGWFGNTPEMKFEQAPVPLATAEQFRAALEAVREVNGKEGIRQSKEASEDGTVWRVLDHDPMQFDLWQNYRVIEVLKTHKRNYNTFVVRTQLNAYSAKGGWAWSAGKFRYVVYVRDDGKVLAVKRNEFSNLIDFYDWKMNLQEADAKKEKLRQSTGYSHEESDAQDPSATSAM
ncbi:MAG: hypothetical protein AB7K68_02905 [Bacteriovoracia bacterium]